jgi:hypothetical protein
MLPHGLPRCNPYLAPVPRCSTLEARPRDAEAAAAPFQNSRGIPILASHCPGHQVLPSRFEQTPPSALCTLHSALCNVQHRCCLRHLRPFIPLYLLALFGTWAETARPYCFEEGPLYSRPKTRRKGSQKIELTAPTTHGKVRHPIRSPSGL